MAKNGDKKPAKPKLEKAPETPAYKIGDPGAFARNMVQVGIRSQQLLADFLRRQASKAGSGEPMDPLNIGGAFSQLLRGMVADPAAIDSPPTPNACRLHSPRTDCVGPYPKAPVSVANGVMFGCSTTPDGPFFAFDTGTGKLLWQFKSGASCTAGAMIMDGWVYWPSGTKLFAFSLAGT